MNENREIKNILVTGGMGFIGSHFVDRCLKLFPCAKIFIWDCLTYAAINRDLPDSCILVEKNVCDDSAAEYFKNIPFDFVAHFAAESCVGRSFENFDLFYETNVVGTKKVLDVYKYIYENINKNCKFLHISTDEVYGEVLQGSADESFKLNPLNPYAKTKAEADKIAQEFLKSGYKIFITRSCNTYGKYQNNEKLIPGNIYRLKNDFPQLVIGDGSAVRQWVFVEDAVDAMFLLLSSDKYGIYNIGTNDCYSVLEILKILTKIAKKEFCVKYIKDWEQNDSRYCVNPKKIKSLGWKQSTDFFDGLKRLYYEK